MADERINQGEVNDLHSSLNQVAELFYLREGTLIYPFESRLAQVSHQVISATGKRAIISTSTHRLLAYIKVPRSLEEIGSFAASAMPELAIERIPFALKSSQFAHYVATTHTSFKSVSGGNPPSTCGSESRC